MTIQSVSFKTQVNAVLRKNAVYQKRRIVLNACIVVLPVVFILLLYALQSYIDTLTDNRDNRCGCLCTLCCQREDSSICREANSTTQCRDDIEECKRYDDEDCRLEFSDPEQAAFCAVQDPTIWPPVLDIPRVRDRPGRWRPDVVVFTTADNPTVRDQLTDHLFPETDVSQIGESIGGVSELSEALSATGVVFGSSRRTEFFNYIEPAFVYEGLTLLSRNCEAETTQIMLNLTNEGLSTASEQLRSFVGTEDSEEGIASCANVQLLPNTTNQINEYIFCNYEEARCNITAEVFGVPYSESDIFNPDQYTQAMDFRDSNESQLSADVWVKDWDFDEEEDDDTPTQRRSSQPINMVANAWLKFATGSDEISSQLLGIQETPKPVTRLNLQFSSFVAVLLFTWVIQMLLPLMLVQLVYEKEENLRIMMKMHGLGDAAYWLVNYMYYLLIYILYIFAFVAVGSAAGFVIFTKNSYGVQLVFLLLFGNVQIAFTFVLSNFFRSSRGCVVFSFLWIFGTGFIGAFLLDTLFGRDKTYNYFIELVPAFAAYRGLWELGEYGFRASYSNSDGITWAKFDDDNNHMGYILIILLLEWPFFMFLAWYLEQVLVTGSGVARHPLFFLEYFRKPVKDQIKTSRNEGLELVANPAQGAPSRSSKAVLDMEVEDETIDESNERRRVEAFTDEEASEHSIIINKLRKVFPAFEGTPEKVAVKGLTMAVRKGEVFGLLGPNGAGKTTTINMLIGFMSSTSGSASVEGFDIGTDMETLYGLMGVCPQHNLLWETLTGYEHLLFYGRLKGLKNEELRQSAEGALKAVNLFHGGVAKKLVKKFSGGMKRRLSVAISLIGSPKVVYLDEPSTGLDPASRRNLWKVVKSAKQNKAIILTTHNMEEAEVLCDRLGIFVDGKLQIIGNPKSLTARYGGYLVFTLITIPGNLTLAAKLVKTAFPSSNQTYSVAGTLKFELPSQSVTPSSVFHFIDDISSKIKVLDWGVASVTLEEVFIKIAKEAGAKSSELP